MYKLKNTPALFVSLILFLMFAAGCAAASAQSAPEKENTAPTSQTVLTISGSGSVTAVLEAIGATFATDTPGYTINVLPGSGTGGGVEGIVKEVLDVAAMARPPKDEEAAQNVDYFQIGLAGQAIITHPDNEVSDLSKEQMTDIFTGKITNWSDVGGPNLPIILFVRDEGDSSTKALREFALDDTPFPDNVADILTSQGDMLNVVAGTPGSIGIATWPSALARESEVKPISIDGLEPGNPRYPMTSTLGIGYLTNRQGDVQPLIDWLGSEEGHTALEAYDVIIADK